MGVYGPSNGELNLDATLQNPSTLIEAFCYDDILRMPEDQRKAFIESGEAQALVEKGMIGRKTLVKLSKSDDIERRIGMAAIQMAKEKNDPIYDQLIKNRIKERELLGKINNKYSNQALRVAKASQRDYLKGVSGSKFLTAAAGVSKLK